MKQINVLFFLLISLSAFAQTSPTWQEVAVGSTSRGNAVHGYSYSFKSDSLLYDIDTTARVLAVLSRPASIHDKDHITLFDLNTKTPKWNIPVHSRTHEIRFCSKGLLAFDGYKTTCYSRSRGTFLWDRKGVLLGVSAASKVGVDEKGNVINLENGQKLFNGNIKQEYGINHIEYNGTNTILVAADGLYGIDLSSRKTWGYESKTGWKYHAKLAKEPETAFGGFLIGMALGGVTIAPLSSFLLQQSRKKAIVYDAGSNIVVENNRSYFASLEALMCIDIPSGSSIFHKQLDGAKTSLSNIKIINNSIYVLNYGYTPTSKKNAILCGHPFIASFDKRTGEQNYLASVGPKGVIVAAKYVGDTLLINYGNKSLHAYNIETGQRFLSKSLKDTGLPEFESFLHPYVMYTEKKGGTFHKLSETYPGVIFIRKSGSIIYSYTIAENKAERLLSPVWERITTTGGNSLMKNATTVTLLSDEKNAAVINLNNVIVAGSKLVSINKNTVTVVDLDRITSEP